MKTRIAAVLLLVLLPAMAPAQTSNFSPAYLQKLSRDYGKLVRAVKPVQVTARAAFSREARSAEVLVTFWSCGGVVPGLGEIRMRVKVAAPAGEEPQVDEWAGYFTGGPDGQIWLWDKNPPTRLVLRGGRVIAGALPGGPEMEIPIDNPEAFAGWPEKTKTLNAFLRKVRDNQLFAIYIQEILKFSSRATEKLVAGLARQAR